MITEGSRYQTGTVVRVPDAKGVFHTTIFRSVPPAIRQGFTTYVWQGTDRLDTVAATKLGDPELFWMILDLNPEIVDPLSITVGTTIRIPTGVFIQ